MFRRKLSRARLPKFMVMQPPCVVPMEVCASSHHWGRAIGDLGHEVRLIPPAYVKPFEAAEDGMVSMVIYLAEWVVVLSSLQVGIFMAERSGTRLNASARNATPRG